MERHGIFYVCRLRCQCLEIQNLLRYEKVISFNFKDEVSSFAIHHMNPSGIKVFTCAYYSVSVTPLFFFISVIYSAHSCREAPIVLFFIPDGSKPAEAAKTTVVAPAKKAPVRIIFILFICFVLLPSVKL